MGRQENLSENRQGFMLQGINKEFDNNLDVQVFKNDTVRMKNYFITYSGNRAESHFIFYNTTYFDVKNAEFKKGDVRKFENGLYVCKKDHVASLIFYRDKSNWEPIKNFTSEEYLAAKRWDYLACGEKIFDVEPFVQVHNSKTPGSKMQTVSEPGTVHYPHYDIFTHLKDANLAVSGDEKYVRKYSIDTLVGDTIRTAGFLITTSNLQPLIDSVKYKGQTALSIDFNIFDVRDFYLQFPVKRTLTFAFDSLGKSTTEYEFIPSMKIKLGLERVTIEENVAHTDHTGHNHAPDDLSAHPEENTPTGIRYKLDLVTEDYIVLQVRKFPLINVLWLGCIVMFIGTLMAVVYRIKLSRNSKIEKETEI
jgi:cytochrome c-type biogenesis protein CcmF